jgi:beta-N-acetylhexosaminidase
MGTEADTRLGSGEALCVGFEGTALPDEVRALAARHGLGGVILFARNCPSLDAVLALTAACRGLGPDVLVLVDHEGGRVHRLPPPFTRFPPPAVIGRAGDVALAGLVGRAMARELRAAGFDSGLSPVLDCLTEPASTVIGDRAYGADPELVAACGEAFAREVMREGLIPVAKHFPGHGRTATDSHLDLPEVDAPAATLESAELRPFRRALEAGCPAVLVAHVRYPALDPVWPASLSPAIVTGLLRDRLGFAGFVLSDDLEMAAVARRWGVAEAAVRFLQAGGDLALICRDTAAWQAARARIDATLKAGALSLAHTHARRAALRARVRAAGPRPDVSLIGCAEHRALAEEIARRESPDGPRGRAASPTI